MEMVKYLQEVIPVVDRCGDGSMIRSTFWALQTVDFSGNWECPA